MSCSDSGFAHGNYQILCEVLSKHMFVLINTVVGQVCSSTENFLGLLIKRQGTFIIKEKHVSSKASLSLNEGNLTEFHPAIAIQIVKGLALT